MMVAGFFFFFFLIHSSSSTKVNTAYYWVPWLFSGRRLYTTLFRFLLSAYVEISGRREGSLC